MSSSSYPDLARAKGQLVALRIRELTDVLDALRLRKHGRKPDLINRVIDYLNHADSDARTNGNITRLKAATDALEAAYAKLVADGGRGVLYMPAPAGAPSNPAPAPPPAAPRPMPQIQHPTARAPFSSATATSQQAPAANGHAFKQSTPQLRPTALARPFNATPPGLSALPIPTLSPQGAGSSGRRIQCVCGQGVMRGTMVQCSICKVMQHADCLSWPLTAPIASHVCERCRAEQCDPFWQIIDQAVAQPARLHPTGRSAVVGTKAEPVLQAERSFTISSVHYDLVKKRPKEYRLQVACLQLHDACTFRFHWPTNCELRVNGMQYRVYSRSPSAKMGANQRDEPANISVLCSHGKTNKVCISGADGGHFVMLVQLAKTRTMQEVKALMQKRESIEQAVARVKKQAGGGVGDDEVEVTNTIIPLRCPLTGARITTPARFTDVAGLTCFDLDSFLSMAEKSRKWQCPNSMKFSCIRNLQIDTFLELVLAALANSPDVNEVEIDSEGRWRPGGSGPAWHKLGDMPYTGPNALKIKTEAGGSAPGLGPTGAGGGGGDESDDDESEDEYEELRKAAAAMKRARPQPDVIEILDSSDDEGPASLQKRPNTGTHLGGDAGPSRPAAGHHTARPPAQQQQQQHRSVERPHGGASGSSRPNGDGGEASSRPYAGGSSNADRLSRPVMPNGNNTVVGGASGGGGVEGFGGFPPHLMGSLEAQLVPGRPVVAAQHVVMPLPPGFSALHPRQHQHPPHPAPIPVVASQTAAQPLGLAILSTAAIHAGGGGRSGPDQPRPLSQQQLVRSRPLSQPAARPSQPAPPRTSDIEVIEID